MTEENENITAEDQLQQVQQEPETDGPGPEAESIEDDELQTPEKRPEPAPLPRTLKTDEGHEVTLESVVEAILFASDEPITPNRLVNTLEVGSVKQIRESVENLNEKYKQANSAFRIDQIAGGFQMMTLDAYNHWLKKLIRVRTENKLTQASLETLAIIAYKQPIIRADVEAIRGVGSGEMIRGLMHKGMVKIAGRAEILGRPLLYGTTKKFLDVFGLNSVKDLPKAEELKKPKE
ncbi:MAG: SMC-Scp complex subunit ScpB [Planctomycetes bacterium]|nr:SMC-Scp complex subunit ScpB [Planctomycetota bacterium]